MLKRKSLFIVLIFIMLLPSNVLASKEDHINDNDGLEPIIKVETKSEYELLKELSKESRDTLKEQGHSEKEIDDIYNIEEVYAEHIRKVSLQSTEILKEQGYTDEQIKALKNFKGTEEEMALLAATLSFSGSYVDYVRHNASTNKTVARIVYTWKWAGQPKIKRTDNIGIGYNEWDVTGRTNPTVRYIRSTGHPDEYLKNISPPALKQNAYLSELKIPMQEQDNLYYAGSGTGAIHLTSVQNGKIHLRAHLKYGHSTASIIPSLSISTNPFSFEIAPKSREMDDRPLDQNCCTN